VRALPVDDAGSESDETTTGQEHDPVEPIHAEAHEVATLEPEPQPEPEPNPEPQPTRIETSSPAYEPSGVDTIEAPTSQPDADAEVEPEPESAPESEPVPEPEPEPEPAAPIVAWQAPTSTVSDTTASTNGDRVPPAPSDDARYDDIWTAAFAPPQQADEESDREPQASRSESAAPEVAEPQAAELEGSEPQASEPMQMTEPPADEAETAAAAEPAPEAAAEDRPAPPEDEVSAEDDMWSLRARLADAAARKHPPHMGS
jgi:hypothetical protein